MKKFIMALSILAMGGSAFVGVLNRKDLIEEKEWLAQLESDVKTTGEELTATEEQVEDAEQERMVAQDANNQAKATFSERQLELRGLESKMAANKEELDKINIEQQEADIVIAKLGVKSVDELKAQEQMKKDKLQENENTVSNLTTQEKAKSEELAAVQTNVRGLQVYQLDRAKKIALNGLEATVIAVNRQYGFVLVNAGAELGVSEASSLLVKRGQDRIARLRVASLEPDMVVADVIRESVPAGERVMPGDKVIFENPPVD